MFENFPTAFCVAVFIFSPPPFVPPPERGICFGGFVVPRPSGGFVLSGFVPRRGGFAALPPPAFGGGIKGGGI